MNGRAHSFPSLKLREYSKPQFKGLKFIPKQTILSQISKDLCRFNMLYEAISRAKEAI